MALKRTFTPPLEELAGGELVLLVRAAAPDRTGTGVIATLEAWSGGNLAHAARLDLSSDLTRRRFIKTVTQRRSEADPVSLEAALMKLSSQLPDYLRHAEARTGATDAVPLDTLR